MHRHAAFERDDRPGQKNTPSYDMPDLHDPVVMAALAQNRQAFLGFLVWRMKNRADAGDVLEGFCINVLTRS